MSVKTYMYLSYLARELIYLALIMVWLTVISSTPAEFIVKISGWLLAFTCIKLFKKNIFLKAVFSYSCIIASPWIYTFLSEHYQYTPIPLLGYCLVAVCLHTYVVIRDCYSGVKLMQGTVAYQKAEAAAETAKKSFRELVDSTIDLIRSIFDRIFK